MIALDLCQPHYRNLLIIYLNFTKKNAKDVNQYVILLDLKIINYITNATNVKKKRQLKLINGLMKKFRNIYQFCNGDINKFVFCY